MFFVWLADRPGYKARISYVDAEYFNRVLLTLEGPLSPLPPGLSRYPSVPLAAGLTDKRLREMPPCRRSKLATHAAAHAIMK